VIDCLDGVRVLDFTQNLAGPTCTQVLADLGADVIKVEPPEGDAARAWGPPFRGADATIFRAVNHGKRSVVADLGTGAGRSAVRRLVSRADVLVESFRPGVMARFGLDAGSLLADQPGLVYASISAYGERGPRGDDPGFDSLMQAHAGIVSVTGHPDAPVRAGASIVDTGTALWATIAILGALRERDRTGAGGHIRAALFETALAYNAYHIAGYLAGGEVPTPRGNAFPLIAPYGEFPTADGRIVIAPASDRLFRRLCLALGLEGLAEEERLASNAGRVAAREELDRAVSAVTSTRTTAELLAQLREAGVPCAPVLDIAEVCADDQTRGSGALDCDRVLPPVTWNGLRPRGSDGIPAPGEHNTEVFTEGDDGDS
jgi:crotonobetainyl-CoA:carnitine CoA-transferase CaiB-like acyl-CoA transferase